MENELTGCFKICWFYVIIIEYIWMVKNVFVHIGGDFMVALDDIIAVFDLDSTTSSKVSQNFIIKAEHDDILVTISDDLPRSFVVTMQEGLRVIYLTPISSSALRGRINSVDFGVTNGGNLIG